MTFKSLQLLGLILIKIVTKCYLQKWPATFAAQKNSQDSAKIIDTFGESINNVTSSIGPFSL